MGGTKPRSGSEPIERLFSLFLILYRLREKRAPVEAPTRSDLRALRDLLEIQCLGRYAWAEREVRAMFSTPGVAGASFHKRYRSYVSAQVFDPARQTRRGA